MLKNWGKMENEKHKIQKISGKSQHLKKNRKTLKKIEKFGGNRKILNKNHKNDKVEKLGESHKIGKKS